MKLKVKMAETAWGLEVTNADTGEQIRDCTAIWVDLSPEAAPAANVIFRHGKEQRSVRITELTCILEGDDTSSVEEELLFRKELFFIWHTLLQRADESLLVLSTHAIQELGKTIDNDVYECISRYVKGTAQERKGLLQEFKNKRYYVKEEEPEDEDAEDEETKS